MLKWEISNKCIGAKPEGKSLERCIELGSSRSDQYTDYLAKYISLFQVFTVSFIKLYSHHESSNYTNESSIKKEKKQENYVFFIEFQKICVVRAFEFVFFSYSPL